MNELAILVEYDNLKKHETPNPAAIRELLGQRISNLMDIALVTDIRVPQPWIQSRNLEVPQVDYFNAIHQNPGMHILSLTARDSSGIIGGHSTAIHIFANNQGVYFDPNVGSVEVRNSATSAQFCHDFFTHALSHLWRKAQGNRSITVEINRTVELT